MLARACTTYTAFWYEFGSIRWALGWSAAKWVRFQRWRERVFRWQDPYCVHTREAQYLLWVRPGTSDLDAFRQVFLEREYAALGDVADVDLVIDCGANVGYTSAWFLSRYPSCRLVAVEPDSGNFAMLQRNLAPYGDRVRLVRAGLWSRPCGLKISEASFRDGREWSVQVREACAGETADLTAVDLGSLLTQSDAARISILKIDSKRPSGLSLPKTTSPGSIGSTRWRSSCTTTSAGGSLRQPFKDSRWRSRRLKN